MLSDLRLSDLRIFPLPNVVLFPSVRMPLHIFEPRYREMTRDALASDRVIAMVLLRSESASEEARRPEIYGVGCAGVIVDHNELADGRFNLLLEGRTRFRISTELDTEESFRRVHAEAWPELPEEENDRSLITALEDLRPGLEANVLALAERQDPKGMAAIAATLRKLETAELINLVAFGLDCSPLEKQALLEAPEMLRRAEMLDRMLRFQIAESTLPEAPRNLH